MAYSRSPHRASDSVFLAWDSLLGVQTDLFLPYEHAFLLACPQWSVAIVETSKSFDFPFDETRVELEGWAAKRSVIWPSWSFVVRVAARG